MRTPHPGPSLFFIHILVLFFYCKSLQFRRFAKTAGLNPEKRRLSTNRTILLLKSGLGVLFFVGNCPESILFPLFGACHGFFIAQIKVVPSDGTFATMRRDHGPLGGVFGQLEKSKLHVSVFSAGVGRAQLLLRTRRVNLIKGNCTHLAVPIPLSPQPSACTEIIAEPPRSLLLGWWLPILPGFMCGMLSDFLYLLLNTNNPFNLYLMLVCHLHHFNEPASLIFITKIRVEHCGIGVEELGKNEANIANGVRRVSRSEEVVFDKYFESGKKGGADEGQNLGV